jgi:WD40 repeat protein
MLSKHNRIYIFSLLLLSLLVFVTAADDSVPHFGDGVIILPLSDILDIDGLDNEHKYELWNSHVELSANGNFVLFHWRGWREFEHSSHLWDLRDIDVGAPIELQPSVSSSPIRYPTGFAFSPDDKFVIIKDGIDILLYTLPDLRLRKSTYLYGTAYSSVLSNDNNLFATTIIGESSNVVVWDIVNDLLYSQEINCSSWRCQVSAMFVGDGLLVLPYYPRHFDWDFMFCDAILTYCEEYMVPQEYGLGYVTSYMRASPHGETILSVLSSEDNSTRITRVWSYENGSYVLEEEPFAIDGLVFPSYLSPSGQYLISHLEKEWTVWDFETQTQVQTLSRIRPLLWLPDEDYFVTLEEGTVLRLYQLGQNEPIEELDLASIYPIEYEDIPDVSIVHSISQDGRKVLSQFGSVLFVIPIEYE